MSTIHYTKLETNYLIQQAKNQFSSIYGIAKPIKINESAPTEIGWYKPESTGVYSNIGLEAKVGYDTVFFFDGASWSKVEMLLTGEGVYVKEDELKEQLGIKMGVNIADLSKRVQDHYYNWYDGNVYPADGLNAMGLYKIESNTEYKVPLTYADQTAFFDINKNFISGLTEIDATGNDGVTRKFTTPNNAAFIGLSVKDEHLSAFMFAKSTEYPKIYTPYEEYLDKIMIATDNIFNLFDSVRDILGVYTINIIDKTKIVYDKYFNYVHGQLSDAAGFVALGKYPIESNTEYKISDFYTDQFAFFDKDGVFISGIAQVDSTTHKFTTPVNAKFIGLTGKEDYLNSLVLSKSNEFPTNYVPYGMSFKDLIISTSKLTEIIVSADVSDNTAQFKGKNAIQEALDSIVNASETNRYVIVAKQGLYKITQANEFIGNIGYPAMVCPKDWVDIVGQGEDRTIVWAELPYNDSAIGVSVDGNNYPRDRYQTLYNYAGNHKIKGITFVAKNLRYTNHQDDPRGTNKTRYYENVSFIFKGDKGTLKPYGLGTSSGEVTHVKGGKALSDSGDPFAIHNNTAFLKPSVFTLENKVFGSLGSTVALELQNDGSLLQDEINLIGCSFEAYSYKINYVDVWLKGNPSNKHDSFNHAEWQVNGHSNAPFLFDNLVKGYCLKIKSNTTGVNSKVRFNKNSSAYPLLIQNSQGNSNVSLFINKRAYVDGYIVEDGSVGLNGEAFGCKDVSESSYAYESGINYTSLGKRLGDCIAVNKSLEIIIDGIGTTITFNKNYNTMTNSQIITEINTAIAGKGEATLHIYGRDYYPEIPDVLEKVYNESYTAFIPKGTIVTKVNGRVRAANEGDKIAGVALDNIPVLTKDNEGVIKGEGRILKKGFIYTDPTKAHFVKCDNTNPTIGMKFKIVNGQLISDSNGFISISIDNGVVSINC